MRGAALASRIDYPTPGTALQRHVPDDFLRNSSKSFHQVAPFSRPETKRESSPVSHAPTPRIDREQAPIHKLDRSAVGKRICAALEADYGDLKSKHKEIADDAGVSPKTVEAWMQGVSLPGLMPTLRLMAESSEFAKAALELCALEADLDPRFQRALAELLRAAGK